MAATKGALMSAATGPKGKAVNDRIADDVVNRIIENSSSDFRDYLESQRGGGINAAVSQAMGQQAVPTRVAASAVPVLNPYPQEADPRAELLRQLGVI